MRKIKMILTGIASIVAGIMLIITAYSSYVDTKDFKSMMAETTATVTDVEPYKTMVRKRSGRRRRYVEATLYKANFKYKANGEIFNDVKDFKDPVQAGYTFTGWYDKSNPSNFRESLPSFGAYIGTGLVGGLFILMGGLSFFGVWETRKSK